MEVSGTTKQLKTTLPIAIAIKRALRDKDIGSWVGVPEADFFRYKKHSQFQLSLFWATNTEMPFFKPDAKGKKLRVTLTIPNVKKSRLNYSTIRQVMGGSNGYLWGRFWASADMSCGGKIRVFAGSEAEAISRLREAVSMSESDVLSSFTGEELDEGFRDKSGNGYKETTRIYPYQAAIINTELLFLNERRGKKQLDGSFARKYSRKLDVYYQTEPTWFDKYIQEATRRGN